MNSPRFFFTQHLRLKSTPTGDIALAVFCEDKKDACVVMTREQWVKLRIQNPSPLKKKGA